MDRYEELAAKVQAEDATMTADEVHALALLVFAMFLAPAAMSVFR